MVRTAIFLLLGLLLKIDIGIAAVALLGFMASGMMLGMKSEQVRNVVHLLVVGGAVMSDMVIANDGPIAIWRGHCHYLYSC